MNRLIGQVKAKRGIAAALIHPYLDRVCITGSGGTGKTTLLEIVLSYYPKEKRVIIPAHVATEKLLGGKQNPLFSHKDTKQSNQSILRHMKAVITDNFALMPERNQHLLVQLLKNPQLLEDSSDQTIKWTAPSKWFYCLDQKWQDPSVFKHAKLCVRLNTISDVDGRRDILMSKDDTDEYGKKELEEAKQRIPSIAVSDEMLQLAVEIVLASGCKNQEADRDMVETARALAALDTEGAVASKHIEEAAVYTLSHRLGEQPESSEAKSEEKMHTDESETSQEEWDDQNQNKLSSEQDFQSSASDRDNEQNRNQQNHAGQDDDQKDKEGTAHSLPDEDHSEEGIIEESVQEEVDQVMEKVTMQADFLFSNRQQNLQQTTVGKRKEGTSASGHGRMIRAVNRPTESVSFYHTLAAAAPFKDLRTSPKDMVLAVEKDDLRYKLKEKQQGVPILFLVDASRSIAAKKRMRMVKGAIMELLQESYQRRDRIALVTFRKSEAEMLLPFTNRFAEAKRTLGEIPTGGKTPLAAGLKKALEICLKERRMHKQEIPYIIILTDGKANETLKPGGTAAQAREEAYQLAGKIAREQIPTTVIDTQSGRHSFGLAEDLAASIRGDYFGLRSLTDKTIAETVKNTLHSSVGVR